MTTKAYKELYAMATDTLLNECLMNYQFGNARDFDLGLHENRWDTFRGTKTESITQLLLYVSRKTFYPYCDHSKWVEKYAPFKYEKLREDVKKLVQELSDREWGWIDKKLAALESEPRGDFGFSYDVQNPSNTLQERKDFRSDLNTIHAFR